MLERKEQHVADDSSRELVALDGLEELVADIAEQPIAEHPDIYAKLDDQLSRRLADLDDLD